MMDIFVTYADSAKSIGPEMFNDIEKCYVERNTLVLVWSYPTNKIKTIINLNHVAKYDIFFKEEEKDG